MWYSDRYRRLLCDMHLEDWDPAFLSEFSADAYFENLINAKIQNAMLYFQSHVGYCYYPTQSGHMHRAFIGREDSMRQLVDRCRANDIKVTGYYSLIYNNWAHDTYPAWRMLDQNGHSLYEGSGKSESAFASGEGYRYGLCCPNNEDYRKFVYQQIDEMLAYFSVDGMFYDMPYWPHLCYCGSCQERWAKEVGGRLPETEDWNDPLWLLHIQKRREWMGEFAQAVSDYTRAGQPALSIEYNMACAVLPDGRLGISDLVNEACDYAGGDLYGGLREQSFTCKFYRNLTNHQPFEYMFSRCDPNLAAHTITKTEDMIRMSVFLTCAHHGATLVIDAMDPVGTLDARVYQTIGRIFQEEMLYEPYLSGELAEDAGVYYSMKSKFNAQGDPFSNHTCAVNTVRTLAENHWCTGVTGAYHAIEKYPLLIAPCLTAEDAADRGRLISYVKGGGALYLSGGSDPNLVEALLGGRLTGFTAESRVYLAPAAMPELPGGFTEKYPFPFDGHAAVLEGVADADVLAKLTLPYTMPGGKQFASIHSDPPGIPTELPGIIYKKVGAGQVIWSAVPIEHVRMEAYQTLFLWLLERLLPKRRRLLSSSAPRRVELVVFRQAEGLQVNAVTLQQDGPVETVQPFSVSLHTARRPQAVRLLPAKREIPFTYADETVTFQTEPLHIFAMYQIIL